MGKPHFAHLKTRLIRSIYSNLPKKYLVMILQFRSKSKFKNNVEITLKDDLICIEEFNQDSSDKVFFYHPIRVGLYYEGIQSRLDELLTQYCVNQLPKIPEGWIVDIGSNIGEFTMAIHRRFPGRKFLRFEPSQPENRASIGNMQGIDQIIVDRPLFSEVTRLEFYDANETGDSSIFPTNESNRSSLRTTSTLDLELDLLGNPMIALLKLEAEGAEPEILKGGLDTLQRTFFVVADLGPERGLKGERTFEASSEILKNHGFRLHGRNPGNRECFLFVNQQMGLSRSHTANQ